jgi:HPt (histidine-containing phosphotransfer) domain-containing protein
MRCLAEQLENRSQNPSRALQPALNSDRPSLPGQGSAIGSKAVAAGVESDADAAKFVCVVKEQLNAMHFALQHGQFATIAQLAGSLKQTAGASGHGEFHTVAMRLEKLAEEQTVAEIEDSICALAILSESIALRSLKPAERPSECALHEAAEAGLPIPDRLPPPRDALRRRPPLVSSLSMDDPDFRRIVEGFIERLRQQALAMQAAWERRDLDELARLAHWLKGAGGTVGFDALTDPARKLELLAKQKQVDEIGDALGEVLDMIDSAAIPRAEKDLSHASS